MRTILAAALVLACPATLLATVIVKTDLELPLSGVYLPGQTVSFDAYLENTDPTQNLRANAFTIVIDGIGFGTGPGLPRFVIPPPESELAPIRYPLPSDAHPYVFTDYLASEPAAYPVDPASGLSNAGTVVLTAALPGTNQGATIGPARNGVARLSIVIPPDAVPGRYLIDFRDGWFAIGFADAEHPVDARDTFIAIFPEPGALYVLGLAALTALRRRPWRGMRR